MNADTIRIESVWYKGFRILGMSGIVRMEERYSLKATPAGAGFHDRVDTEDIKLQTITFYSIPQSLPTVPDRQSEAVRRDANSAGGVAYYRLDKHG